MIKIFTTVLIIFFNMISATLAETLVNARTAIVMTITLIKSYMNMSLIYKSTQLQ